MAALNLFKVGTARLCKKLERFEAILLSSFPPQEEDVFETCKNEWKEDLKLGRNLPDWLFTILFKLLVDQKFRIIWSRILENHEFEGNTLAIYVSALEKQFMWLPGSSCAEILIKSIVFHHLRLSATQLFFKHLWSLFVLHVRGYQKCVKKLMVAIFLHRKIYW